MAAAGLGSSGAGAERPAGPYIGGGRRGPEPGASPNPATLPGPWGGFLHRTKGTFFPRANRKDPASRGQFLDYTVRGLLAKPLMPSVRTAAAGGAGLRETLHRILALIQGSHQEAVVMFSSLDLQTQEAWEMAVRGLIRPMSPSPMLVTGIRCLHFAPPEFLGEGGTVQRVHETQKQLRRLEHEVGLELKSSAVCTQGRCTRDGFFTPDDALQRTQRDGHGIQDVIRAAAPRVAAGLEKSLKPGLAAQRLPRPGQPRGSERTSSAPGGTALPGQAGPGDCAGQQGKRSCSGRKTKAERLTA
ncbi:pseudouridylate synthase TRUB2, mitochondrial-like [Talpa occidentalis]|uniref:pseudouridylate synthase TRUB2, mitochondrial-like n=1 Tax=Talpa occidentalis TaxID=50954 RepID=UPI0023F66099|nr:pseudouridylate synthase TRUB2, mitochondrial-like [Talpa occidentalis]